MPYSKGDGPSVVVTLGGNALGENAREQLELSKNTARHIVDMVYEGTNVVITHGNGPQVGMIYNVFDMAFRNPMTGVPPMPYPECSAMSQGYIGYQLAQAILGELRRRNIMRSTANVITQTVVDPNDPAFANPVKPVGAFMTEKNAKALAKETGCAVCEDSGRGWRRVVASPQPLRIVEIDAVKDLVEHGYIVVTAGGGGIPVVEKNGSFCGVTAVIDKDNTSAMLASAFQADMLVILTVVEKVSLNFGKPNQRDINEMTVAQARTYIEQGQFAPGSMLPKIQACIKFVEAHPTGRALITSLERAAAGMRGETGTIVTA